MALPKRHSCSPDRALEMCMRDVRDGLEELACISAHSRNRKTLPDDLEILSIEPPPEKDPILNSTRASIHCLPVKNQKHNGATIAEWLIRQEKTT